MQPIRTAADATTPASAAPSASGRCGGAAGPVRRGAVRVSRGASRSVIPADPRRAVISIRAPTPVRNGGGRQRTVARLPRGSDRGAARPGGRRRGRTTGDDAWLREESFDSFYRATRRPVLHQAFALTGDLPAAQSAVRDAYVGAWQHWRKVSRLEDPLDWVRPRAWQLAQRRHTARIWHRNKGLSERAQGRPRRALLAAGRPAPACCCSSTSPGSSRRTPPASWASPRTCAEQNLPAAATESLTARLGVDPGAAHVRVVALDALLERRLAPPRPDHPPGRPQAPPGPRPRRDRGRGRPSRSAPGALAYQPNAERRRASSGW